MQRIDGAWQPTITDEAIYGFFGEYRWLSNFHVSPATYAGVVYPSSEHAYQAAKTLDEDVRALFLKLPEPRQAKKFGQVVEIRDDWEMVKVSAMTEAVWSKFTLSPELGAKLMATDPMYLEETNYWGDTYWGVCNRIGKNQLGRILQLTRGCLLKLKSNTLV